LEEVSLEITIVNWDKYNPKRAQHSYRWFRFDNEFFTDKKLYDLDCECRCVFLFLLCTASKENSGKYDVERDYIQRQTGISNKKIDDSIKLLILKGVVATTKRCSSKSKSLPLRDETNETRRDETNETRELTVELFDTKQKSKTPGAHVFDAYANAYASRYNISPKRNSKVNSQCKQLAERLGVEDAVKVVTYYISLNEAYYTRNMHPIGYCLNDAESLYTKVKSGINMGRIKANQIERTSHNIDAINEGFEIFNKIKEGKNGKS
jgi:hypothetical protein